MILVTTLLMLVDTHNVNRMAKMGLSELAFPTQGPGMIYDIRPDS